MYASILLCRIGEYYTAMLRCCYANHIAARMMALNSLWLLRYDAAIMFVCYTWSCLPNAWMDNAVQVSSPISPSMGVPGTVAQEQRSEYFFSSDAAALVEHTKRVLIMEDDDLVHVGDGDYTLYQV